MSMLKLTDGPPRVILERLAKLKEEIKKGQKELEGLLK